MSRTQRHHLSSEFRKIKTHQTRKQESMAVDSLSSENFNATNRVLSRSGSSGIPTAWDDLKYSTREPVAAPEPKYYETLLADSLRKHGLQVSTKTCLHGYFPDILLPNQKLIIEVDGGVHNTPKTKLMDAQRTEILANRGYTTIRFKNWQVQKNLSGVVANILKRIKEIEHIIDCVTESKG